MLAVLRDLEENREKGEIFLQLEKQIREAVYDAEDILDACLTEKSVQKMSFLSLAHVDLAKKVKQVRVDVLQPIFTKLMEWLLALRPMLYSSCNWPEESHLHMPRKSQSWREDNVVGLVDEEETLMKYIFEETETLDVISIVGMPGLGKTSMTQKIFQNKKIQNDFPILIWVYVSQDFNMRLVLLTILKKFCEGNILGLDDEDLIQEVRKRLENTRYLLVLDDVWTMRDWKAIETVLPKNNKKGKVLITSRHAGVAAQANCNREPHKLRLLNFEESWALLQLEVFGKHDCPKELEGLGTTIALQCGGVPLALVIIGGILVDREYLWKKVSETVRARAYVQDKCIENMILLSYKMLRDEVIDCFLYLGVFPKDMEISAWKLTRLWMAEGFIRKNAHQSLEEAAEENLNELVARNLVTVEKTKANGDIKTCRVHDMIRDFCQNEAAFGRKNLFQHVKKTRQGVFHPDLADIERRRRICIHSNVIDFLQRRPKGPKVRSFLCFSKEIIALPIEQTCFFPESLSLLRIMDADSIGFTKFPAKMTELIHLRYLTLSVKELKSLPEAVSKLWNLQTVKIHTGQRELEIKHDIGKMKQLRHFKTKAGIVLKEIKDNWGENLQTLSRLSVRSCMVEVFSRASNLMNLGIRGDLTTLVDEKCLILLENLEKLKLVHDTYPGLPSEKPLYRLTLAHYFPPSLRNLVLSSTNLDWTEMTNLGSLPYLEVLKLKETAFKGSVWKAEGPGFPRLKSLHILHSDLETWTASDDTFPNLKILVLKECVKLREIPLLLGKSLQLVEIEIIAPTLVESARKIERAKQEIQSGQVGGKSCGFKLKISHRDDASPSLLIHKIKKFEDVLTKHETEQSSFGWLKICTEEICQHYWPKSM